VRPWHNCSELLDTIRVAGGLDNIIPYLLQELLLHSYVVISDAQDNDPVLRLFALALTTQCLYGVQFIYEFVLYQDQGLHRMLEGQLMLSHLAQNGANIEVNVAWI